MTSEQAAIVDEVVASIAKLCSSAVPGIVKAVTEASNEAEIDIGEAVDIDAMLKGNGDSTEGFTLVPAKGSQVFVSYVGAERKQAVITGHGKLKSASFKIGKTTWVLQDGEVSLETDKLEIDAKKTTFNGGGKLGLVEVLGLVQQLNLIVADVNALKALLATLGAFGTNAQGAPVLGANVAPFSAYAIKVLMPVEPTMLANSEILQ